MTLAILCSSLVITMASCQEDGDTGGSNGSGATTATAGGAGAQGGVGGTGVTGGAGGTGTGGSGGTGTGGGATGGTGGTGGTGVGGAGGTGGAGGGGPLGPGDLCFIGVNSDIPEGFALVPLVDLPSGTELRFTERAWNETDGAFEVPEGTATLTLTTSVAAGSVFEIAVTPPSTLAVAPSIGTITDDATGNWGVAGNGDNLFVYVGPDASPTFIAGIAFSSPNVWTVDDSALDGQSSMIPGTLSEAAGTITTFTPDNLRYTGPRTGQGSMAAYLPLIADEGNYETGTAAYSPLRGTDFSP